MKIDIFSLPFWERWMRKHFPEHFIQDSTPPWRPLPFVETPQRSLQIYTIGPNTDGLYINICEDFLPHGYASDRRSCKVLIIAFATLSPTVAIQYDRSGKDCGTSVDVATTGLIGRITLATTGGHISALNVESDSQHPKITSACVDFVEMIRTYLPKGFCIKEIPS